MSKFRKKTKMVVCVLASLILAVGLYVMPITATTAFGETLKSERATVEQSQNLAEEKFTSEFGKKLYSRIKADILKIAKGERTSTVLHLDDYVQEIGATNVYTVATADANNIAGAKLNEFYAQFELGKFTTVLLHDLPYDMFWFDKTVGLRYNASIGGSSSGSTVELSISNFTMTFTVVESFKSGENATDVEKIALVNNARQNAIAVVEQNASLSDEKKLEAYRDYICDSVSYNNEAAAGGVAYGNPWSAYYVFDGNDGTKVVCEGYAKAFKFLCDLSTFTKDVKCYLASGQMAGGTGAGPHMWNVVSIGGTSYLVDVTNSDTGSIGSDGGLFMVGGKTGNMTDGYTFTVGRQNILFVYDADDIEFWQDGSSNPLNLATTDYDMSDNGQGSGTGSGDNEQGGGTGSGDNEQGGGTGSGDNEQGGGTGSSDNEQGGGTGSGGNGQGSGTGSNNSDIIITPSDDGEKEKTLDCNFSAKFSFIMSSFGALLLAGFILKK